MNNQSSRLPHIIQGGMGVNISSWQLARTVSMLGQQGTISGTALEIVVAYILSMGDMGGHVRRALSQFPFPSVAESVLKNFFIEGGLKEGERPPVVPVWTVTPSRRLIELTICANYAIVYLAKERHDGIVSINYLEKIAMPHIYAITGAMLAHVDVITMGAGLPFEIPSVINAIAHGETARYRLPVKPLPTGKNISSYTAEFNPKKFFGGTFPSLNKPRFIPIIASDSLANIMILKLKPGDIYGFVVEEPSAGGHNAPPRKKGERVYGEKDIVNYEKIHKLGVPFWIGGAHASPEKLTWALSIGASGIQAGSIFALSEESGMDPEIRREVRRLGFRGELVIKPDFDISPTGFPFKVVQLPGTISDTAIYQSRNRICDKGQLVTLYERADGKIGYRCPSEPEDTFVAKGGDIKDVTGRGCVCNGLAATAHMSHTGEIPIVTLGDDVRFLKLLMPNENARYFVFQIIEYLLGQS